MHRPTPAGVTPPTPGLEHEEPEMVREEDIPADDGNASHGTEESGGQAADGDRPSQEVERE